MANPVPWQEEREVYVGDIGPNLEFTVTESDEATARDLTGYSAWMSFWYEGASGPHVVRHANVSGSTGLINYRVRGDEYTTAGYCRIQWTIMRDADGFRTSGPIMTRRVLVKP